MLQKLSNGYRAAKDAGYWAQSVVLNLTGRGKIADPIADDIEREQKGKTTSNSGFAKFQKELFARLDKMNSLIAGLLVPNDEDSSEKTGIVGDFFNRKISKGSMFNFGIIGTLGLLSKVREAVVGAIRGFISGLKRAFRQIKRLIKNAIRFMKGIRKAFSKVFKFISKFVPKIKSPKFLKALTKPLRAVKKLPGKLVGGILEELGPGVSKFFRILKGIAKRAPIIGLLIEPIIEGIESSNEIKVLIKQKNDGEITEKEFKQKTAESITGAVMDTIAVTAGGSIGAAVLGAALSFIPGAGTLIGGVVGGAAGAVVGQFVSDLLLKPIFAPGIAQALVGKEEEAAKFAQHVADTKALDPGFVIDAVIAPISPTVAAQLHSGLNLVGSAARFLSPFPSAEPTSKIVPQRRSGETPPQPYPNKAAPKISYKDPVSQSKSAVILNNQVTVVNNTRIFAQ